jgi:hypothetical protein
MRGSPKTGSVVPDSLVWRKEGMFQANLFMMIGSGIVVGIAALTILLPRSLKSCNTGGGIFSSRRG